MARSTWAGKNAAAKVFRAGTVSPKPSPSNAVAVSRIGMAADAPSACWLASSKAIASALATSPPRSRSRVGSRRARPAPATAEATASTACGRNSAPYWLAESP
jgi:hypothetical protein